MSSLNFEGKLKAKLPQQSGNSGRGAWVRQDFVLEYQDGSFPAEACFSAWGQDRVNDLSSYQVGQTVRLSFSIKSREYNGRWYNDLRVIRFNAPEVAPAPQPVAPPPMAPPPGYDDMPAAVSDDDDMPF